MGIKTVTDDEIVERLERCPEPAYTTGELAERFDMSVQGMRNRLEALADTGAIRKKKPSARTVIWWVDSDHDSESFSPDADATEA